MTCNQTCYIIFFGCKENMFYIFLKVTTASQTNTIFLNMLCDLLVFISEPYQLMCMLSIKLNLTTQRKFVETCTGQNDFQCPHLLWCAPLIYCWKMPVATSRMKNTCTLTGQYSILSPPSHHHHVCFDYEIPPQEVRPFFRRWHQPNSHSSLTIKKIFWAVSKLSGM